jgi:hypothetical protein
MKQMVAIDRSYLARSFLFALLLLWPLLTFGRPAYMIDSAYYQNGGKTAVTFVARKLHLIAPPPPSVSPVKVKLAPPDEAEGAKVARSIVYSVLGYALSGPNLSMGFLAAFHALCVALTVTALFMAIAGPSLGAFAAMAGILTLGTGLAPVVNFMVPDCFTGIIIGTMMILPLYWRRFSHPMLMMLMGLSAVGVSLHPSLPPVALGTAVLATICLLCVHRRQWRQGWRHEWRTIAMLWLPPLLGVVLTVGTGLIGFGKASLAPKHFPLALARGLDNGPARWYLQEECRDRARYMMCQLYGTDIPETVDEFLWQQPDNVINRATPTQLDRIRAEEKTILIHATLRYPLQQAHITLRDIPQQFVRFELDYFHYTDRIVQIPGGKIKVELSKDTAAPPLLNGLSGLQLVIVIISAIALGLIWRRLSDNQRLMLLVLFSGLLVNAAICAIFSGVAPRYQARIIWLVPFAALALGFALRTGGKGDKTVREGL